MKKIITALLGFAFLISANAQTGSVPDKMQWWREARFGLFIHWGVYAQWGGVYQGRQQARGGAEWIMNRSKIPVAEYQQRARSFNPTQYDPDAWVKLAKQAGMKYIVITAKHHDGFALFKSAASPWNVADATEYGKDLLKPLAEACRKYGMKLGFYYSQAQDWNNPGGTAARKEMKEGWPNPDSAKVDDYTRRHDGHWDPLQQTKTFEQYINGVAVPQVKELLTQYGDVAVIWWDTPVGMTGDAASKLNSLLQLQPGIISNNRLKRPDFPGDFGTPEQKIPGENDLDGGDWESCMTMNGSWGYKSWDHNWKSPETLIRNLVEAVSKGGNYLLNIGPKDDGTIPAESIDRLKVIGNWMDTNGEAIYATQAGPIVQPDWGYCTMKKAKSSTILYLFLFRKPENGELIVPGISNKIIKSIVLKGGQLKSRATGNNIIIDTKAIDAKTFIPVIKLELQGVVKSVNKKSGKEMQSKELD